MLAASAALALVAGAAADEPDGSPLPRVRPLVPCHVATDRAALDPWEAPCVDDAQMVDSNARILAAKTAAANAYTGYLTNVTSKQKYDNAQDWLTLVTGEGNVPKPPSAATIPAAHSAVTAGAKRLQEQFFPFEQTTSYYCGPATVESILSFLGPFTSATADRQTKQVDQLSGDPARDQALLANGFWLATEKHNGTNWGEAYVPFALNAWRGSRWYVQAAGPGVPGGSLSQDQALRDIRYDVDHGYPVAENVLYSAQTYYPAGFVPGVRYTHWDTIYGQTTDETGRPYVQIGQTYHDESMPYARYQQVAWDVHWTAIAAWHGIVW
jgi:hypothetical protein